MIDCPNSEIRDRLPDLLHERLDKATRALVAAHVEGCDDCRAELALLRETRVSLTVGVRSIDVTAIARAVVERTRPTVAPSPRRPSWRASLMDWRVAASIAVLVVGSASAVLWRGHVVETQPITIAPVAGGASSDVGASTAIAVRPPHHEATPSANTTRAELSAGGEVADLSESDLRALLRDLDAMDAVPNMEPEPVAVRVSLPGSGGSD